MTTTGSEVAQPDWLTVGAAVVLVIENRYQRDRVRTGTVRRILGRDIVVVDAKGEEIDRLRRSDYHAQTDHFERWSRSGWDSTLRYMYRADDPRAVAAAEKDVRLRHVDHLKAAISKVDIGTAPEVFDNIAATATKLGAMAREHQ